MSGNLSLDQLKYRVQQKIAHLEYRLGLLKGRPKHPSLNNIRTELNSARRRLERLNTRPSQEGNE